MCGLFYIQSIDTGAVDLRAIEHQPDTDAELAALQSLGMADYSFQAVYAAYPEAFQAKAV